MLRVKSYVVCRMSYESVVVHGMVGVSSHMPYISMPETNYVAARRWACRSSGLAAMVSRKKTTFRRGTFLRLPNETAARPASRVSEKL